MLQQEPDTLLGSPPKHTCAHTPTPPPPHTIGVIIQVWQCTAVIPACSKENKTPGPTLLLTCCQYHPQTTVAQDEASRKIRESIPPLTCNPFLLHAERVREELIQELGPGRAPSLSDRARLPYTDAVLHEAQRLLALVPMGMPHALARTTSFRGYTLPQVGEWDSQSSYLCPGDRPRGQSCSWKSGAMLKSPLMVISLSGSSPPPPFSLWPQLKNTSDIQPPGGDISSVLR